MDGQWDDERVDEWAVMMVVMWDEIADGNKVEPSVLLMVGCWAALTVAMLVG